MSHLGNSALRSLSGQLGLAQLLLHLRLLCGQLPLHALHACKLRRLHIRQICQH